MKGVALNLKHSPENQVFWVRADPVHFGAGYRVRHVNDECLPSPRGLRQHRVHNGREVTRRATYKLLDSKIYLLFEYTCQCKKRYVDGTSRETGTGMSINKIDLAMKRLTPAERKFLRLIDRERET